MNLGIADRDSVGVGNNNAMCVLLNRERTGQEMVDVKAIDEQPVRGISVDSIRSAVANLHVSQRNVLGANLNCISGLLVVINQQIFEARVAARDGQAENLRRIT